MLFCSILDPLVRVLVLGDSPQEVLDPGSVWWYTVCAIVCKVPCRWQVTSIVDAGKESVPKRKDNELAEMMKDLCVKLGLTQEQFAAKVGVTWSTVGRWENGRGRPSPLAWQQTIELQEKTDESRQGTRRGANA